MESELVHDRTSGDSIQSNSVMAQYDYGSVCHPYPRAPRPRRGSFRSACSLRRAPQLPQQGWGGRVSGCARRGLICLYRGRIWLGDRWELRSKRRGVWRHSTSVGDPDVVFGGCGRPICSCPGRRLVPLGAPSAAAPSALHRWTVGASHARSPRVPPPSHTT